jgi:metacaspase-1
MDRALLVGINAYPTQPLKGCLNDINDMREELVERHGFSLADIVVLHNGDATRDTIEMELGRLVKNLDPGDRVLFHYSGHGVQMESADPVAEPDGLDEVICPIDFDWDEPRTALRDKDIHQIFQVVPGGVQFVWISDSCHSQGLTRAFAGHEPVRSKSLVPPPEVAARLESIRARLSARLRAVAPEPRVLARAWMAAHVGLLAACSSHRTAVETTFGGRPNGAFTRLFLDTLVAQPDQSLVDLVRAVAVKTARYDQTPQAEGEDAILDQPFFRA